MANRTPPDDWGLLFDPFGGGIVHMENFSEVSMRRAFKQWDNAGILALPDVEQLIIPAPGFGRVIVPIAANIQTNFAAGSYGNIDAGAYAYFAMSNVGVGTQEWSQYIVNDATAGLDGVTQLFAAETRTVQLGALGNYQNDQALQDWSLTAGGVLAGAPWDTNKPLVFFLFNNAAGNLTGGNAANKFRVDVWYDVVPSIT